MRQAESRIEVRTMPEQSPLDVCLSIWVQWQRRADLGIGWRGKSAMLESDGSADSHQLYDNMDNNTAQAVDAMICSLPRHLDWVIRRRCGITTAWRFPSLVFADMLPLAEQELEKKLRKNIATRFFFD